MDDGVQSAGIEGDPQFDNSRRFAVAPMMDWTDRHCRYFHRQFSRRAHLYTEMIHASALVHGDSKRLLDFSPAEHPVALQVGGSDPRELATATRLGCEAGYDEVNLNVGCPSGRVQSGGFGACLMANPERVARCVDAMLGASTGAEVTVKCRIGIDDQDPSVVLPAFIRTVSRIGIRTFAIHARKAWLSGLSPKENRTVPPLDHDLVARTKEDFRHLRIIINGGLATLDQAIALLDAGVDGVMFGREAYHKPASILGSADRRVFGEPVEDTAPTSAVRAMLPYIETEMSRGSRLNSITRHMLGAFAGFPGAREWRRTLSEGATRPGAGPELVLRALDRMETPATSRPMHRKPAASASFPA